jgi:hypothetical protein
MRWTEPRASALAFAALAATLAGAATAQGVRLAPGRIDPAEFEALPGARLLDPTRSESDEAVDLPVRLPVIGLGDRLNEPFIGREADEGPEESFVYDDAEGYWYSQEVTLRSGVVYVEGERRALADSALAGGATTRPATLEDPQIVFIGDEPVGEPAEDAGPTEVMASFELGGAFFHVTLVCAPATRAACADGTEIRRLLQSLEILGRGTRQ